MKKLILAFLLLFATAAPSQAITWEEFWEPFRGGAYTGHGYYRPYYHRPYYNPPQHHHHHYYPRPRPVTEVCTREYTTEEYVPATPYRSGYIKQHRNSERVPCY